MTAPVAFAHPWALGLLLLVFVVLALGRRRLGARWRVATVLRAATLALLALALSGPLVRVPVPGVSVVFAVDRSRSITPEGERAQTAFVRDALARMRSQDRAGVVTFAGRPLVRVPVDARPAVLGFGPAQDPDATDIGAALDLAVRMLPPEGVRRVVVLSDGAENRGDAQAAARAARQAGVVVDAVPLVSGTPDAVLVDQVTAPQEVHPGEAYEVRALVRATVPADAVVTLSRNGVAMATRHLALSPGVVAVPFSETATPGEVVRYRIDVAAPYTMPETSHGEALVVVRDRPRVLFVASAPTQLPRWLRDQGLRIDVRTPEEVPDRLVGFAPYASVVLDDVSALDLSQAQQDGLRAFVGAAGGGLVAIGGPHSYGVGGYAGTPLEDALPVTMDVRQTLALPTVAIVLVIDTSGSMEAFGTELAKEELAKEIASSVIDLLGEHDQIGVITFDQEYRWLVPPTEARERARVLEQIARLKAGGGTVMYPPLRAAGEFLRRSSARIRHVIVLSDGLTDPGDFRGVATGMARDKITVSTVAIGRDADLEFMRNLARWGGGRTYVAKDLYSVPRIFTAEAVMAVRSFVVEEPVPLTRGGAGPTLAALTPPPPILGYVDRWCTLGRLGCTRGPRGARWHAHDHPAGADRPGAVRGRGRGPADRGVFPRRRRAGRTADRGDPDRGIRRALLAGIPPPGGERRAPVPGDRDHGRRAAHEARRGVPAGPGFRPARGLAAPGRGLARPVARRGGRPAPPGARSAACDGAGRRRALGRPARGGLPGRDRGRPQVRRRRPVGGRGRAVRGRGSATQCLDGAGRPHLHLAPQRDEAALAEL